MIPNFLIYHFFPGYKFYLLDYIYIFVNVQAQCLVSRDRGGVTFLLFELLFPDHHKSTSCGTMVIFVTVPEKV